MSAADDFLDTKEGGVAVATPPTHAPAPTGAPTVKSPADEFLDAPEGESNLEQAAGAPPEGEWGKLHAIGIKTVGKLVWNIAWQPAGKVPEAPKDLPDLRYLGPDNPAVLGAVWNGAFKPFLEASTSKAGMATLGLGAVTGGTELRAAKVALRGVSGLFGGMMAKEDIEQMKYEKAIRENPNSSLQDVVESYARQASRELMAVAGLTGAIMPESGGVMKPGDFKGTPGEVANNIRAKVEEAPLEQVDKMKAAADKFDELHTKQSDAAAAWDEVKQLVAPQERKAAGEGEGLSKAKITAGSLREHGGELAQRQDRAEAALEEASKQLMKLSPAARNSFVDAVESPEELPVPEELKAAHQTMREMLDERWAEVVAIDPARGEHFIKDYFPHIWKDPDEAADVFSRAQAKTPMLGSKAFLKHRTIPTTAMGRQLGLEPVSTNPVDLVMLKLHEMNKFILGKKWMQEMKDRDFVKYVKAGEQAPPGYYPIDDPIAKVYGPRRGAVGFDPEINTLTVTPENVTVYGQRTMGQYYAPTEVATVANNYLSPGLRRFASFRSYLGMSNSMNQFQLGLSGFHLGFTSLDTSISKLALALEYAKEGKVGKAGKAAANVPVAPITNALQGNKVLSEWLKPGSQGEEMAKIADAIRMAGGRAKMDRVYQTAITKKMMEMFRMGTAGGKLGALWRAPFAAMEQVSKPLMQWLVPRQKLGVAADLMRKEMEKMGPNAKPEELREAFGKVWDSVDNRMGQLVYDNLFWKKTVKDLAMASVRSVGWDLGTIRELGGGVYDAAKIFGKLVEDIGNLEEPEAFRKPEVRASEKEAEFTHRMAYVIALPTLTGILGATYQYLKTGKGPQELRDYFFPKTGEKDPQGRDIRLAMPSYMKDVYHYAHAPIATLEGKVSPFPAIVAEMLNNKDYFGRDIRNADDPVVKQMMSEAEFFLKSYEPIGVRQAVMAYEAKETPAEMIAPFAGVVRAPAWVGESAAEQLAGKLAGDQFKSASTPDAKRIQQIQQAKLLFRQGKDEQANAILDAMEDADQLTGVQRKNIERGTEHSYLENAVSHLEIDSSESHGPLWRVFKLATPEEREAIGDLVQRRIDKAHIPEEDREELQKQFDKLMPQDRDINHSER